jgi:hypothetical protein
VMMIPTTSGMMVVVGQQVRRYTMNLDTPMKFRYPSLGVSAGVGYVILEAAEDREAIDDGEDSWKLSTLFLLPPYDKSG